MDDKGTESSTVQLAESSWQCSSIGWFSNVLCLKDWATIHAHQLEYLGEKKELAYPSRDSHLDDLHLSRALTSTTKRDTQLVWVDPKESTYSSSSTTANDQMMLVNFIKKKLKGGASSSLGKIQWGGIAVSSIVSQLKNGSNSNESAGWQAEIIHLSGRRGAGDGNAAFSTDGVLFDNGLIILNIPKQSTSHTSSISSSKSATEPYWIVPIEIFVFKLHHTASSTSMEWLASHIIRNAGGALGHYQQLLSKLTCIWCYIQYLLFHILVVEGVKRDYATYPDHWYNEHVEHGDSSSSKQNKTPFQAGWQNFLSSLKKNRTHLISTGSGTDISILQTYLPWWWTMFGVSEKVSPSMEGKWIRKTFKQLHAILSSAEN